MERPSTREDQPPRRSLWHALLEAFTGSGEGCECQALGRSIAEDLARPALAQPLPRIAER